MDNDPLYFEANRSVMTRFLPPSYERVLEVGCASGGFAEHLRPGCEVWGVEPDARAAHAACRRLHRVLTGVYDAVAGDLPEGYFDLVICNDVIEHMSDHDRFLEDIKRKMRPGAALVGSLPNVRHLTALYKLLIARDWPYSSSGILDRTHLRFFTAKSIRRCLAEHGYHIERFAGLGSIVRYGISRRANPLPVYSDAAVRIGAGAVVALSLGWWWDTQYPQYGFRAVRC